MDSEQTQNPVEVTQDKSFGRSGVGWSWHVHTHAQIYISNIKNAFIFTLKKIQLCLLYFTIIAFQLAPFYFPRS